MPDHLFTLWEGFSVGIGLILVIGSQNAFILKQAIKNEHLYFIATFFAIADVFLILFGVKGIGSLINTSYVLKTIMVIGGSLFLLIYGGMAFKHAIQGTTLNETTDLNVNGQQNVSSLNKIVLLCLSFTFLNPHAWLDTVVILGSIAGQYETDMQRYYFALGAILASFVWFYSFSFLAKRFSPYLKSKRAWQIINISVALLLWYITYILIAEHLLE